MSSPGWWPNVSEIGLLDTRDGNCWLGFGGQGDTALRQFCEPAVVRFSSDTTVSHWGQAAQVWKGRRPESEIRELFPQGWPISAELGRSYLKKRHKSHLGKRKENCQLWVVEDDDRGWVRQLWQETLEDSGFSLQGFLSSWQHDMIVAKFADKEAAMSAFLHFRLEDSAVRWRLIKEGRSLVSGEHFGLTCSRLLEQMRSHLRRHFSLDVAPRALLEAMAVASGSELGFSVAGRQTASGLPSRQRFDWAGFVAGQPSVVEAWREVRSQIFAAAKVAPEKAEGLDIPGWRVLTSGRLAPLFVEGPVVRLWDSPR